ncbi:MAG: DUF3786 domain-containing protein [Desulfovibrionales bacterium]|nr:DUF3786 domain-containing protein [Desulfovibrionales bacterium]
MVSPSPVFETHYQAYVDQLKDLQLDTLVERLGGSHATLPFLGQPHGISSQGIVGPKGTRPSYEVCIVLFRHLLMCPPEFPRQGEWVSFKDLREAGPLTVYFRDNVLVPLARKFGGQPLALDEAAKALGGTLPDVALQYDVARVIPVLPRIPLLLLFNGADAEFPAECSLLFKGDVEAFLDAESIAILGHCLAQKLMN